MRTSAAHSLFRNFYDDIQVQKNVMDALALNSKNENLHVRDACIITLENIKKRFSTPRKLFDPVCPSAINDANILRELLFNPEITVIERKETILNLVILATKKAADILGSALAKNEQYMTIPIQLLILHSFREFYAPIAFKELRKIVSNTNIIPCIRHEAVQFLVSMDINCIKFLKAFKNDESEFVRDSVRIAFFRLSEL